MADIQNFTLTPRSSANVNVPRVEISCTINDSQTGAVLSDFTGANTLMFPGVISTLSAEQRLELVNIIAQWLVMTKAGL